MRKSELRQVIREEIRAIVKEARSPKFDQRTRIKGKGADGYQQYKYELGMGYKGNGLTIWNRSIEEHGDYKTVAHIQHPQMTIKWYDKNLPREVKKEIEDIARGEKKAWDKGTHYYQNMNT